MARYEVYQTVDGKVLLNGRLIEDLGSEIEQIESIISELTMAKTKLQDIQNSQ